MVYVGLAAAVATIFAWAISPVMYKQLTLKFDPIFTNAIRVMTTAVTIAPLLLLEDSGTVGLRELAFIMLMALFGPIIGDTVFMKAVQLAGASVATPASYSYIIMVDAVAVVFFEEELSVLLVAGSLLVVMGVYVISKSRSSGASKSPLLGIALAIVAALAWTTSISLLKVGLSMLTPIQIIVYRTAIVSLVLAAVVAVSGRLGELRRVTKKDLLMALAGGLGGTGVGVILYLIAISELGMAQATVIGSGSIMVTELLSRLISKEALGARKIIGSSLVAVGVALASLSAVTS